MTSNTIKYREQWLMEGVSQFRPWLKEQKAPIPDKVAVSVGFPKGGRGGHAIGQCWYPQTSVNGVTNMFVCPTQDEPVRVLDILLHECIHAGCGKDCGHKGEFKRIAKDLGLQGKMTATFAAPETPLHTELTRISQVLGPYPHSGMMIPKAPKKASTWVRLVSPENEKYTLVISQKSLDEYGWPSDPEGNEMIVKGQD